MNLQKNIGLIEWLSTELSNKIFLPGWLCENNCGRVAPEGTPKGDGNVAGGSGPGLFVLEDFRRRGFARSLIASAEETAKGRGFKGFREVNRTSTEIIFKKTLIKEGILDARGSAASTRLS